MTHPRGEAVKESALVVRGTGLAAVALGLCVLAGWVFGLQRPAGLLRLFRQGERLLAATGIAVVMAMLAAGLFEYNFGDSEFLMTFLVLVTLPFAAARDHDPGRAAATSRA